MIKNTIIGIAFLCSITALSVLLYNNSKLDKYVYVDTMKLYAEFEYTKKLNKTLESIVSARKAIMDSLYEDVRVRTQALKYKKNKTDEELNNLTQLQENYFYKKEQFEKENQTTMTNYSSKIWNQINELVSNYGKEKKYTIIFGANGQGNIMYGNQQIDKTSEVIDYINLKFNDKD